MKKRRVFLVDDDKYFIDELEDLLKSCDYELTAVTDPDSAVSRAAEIRPDVILLDLKMPGKNGFQVATEMNSLAETQGIPIIVMSAFVKEEHKFLLNLCGIKKYLKKPFHPLDAIAAIENAMDGKVN